MTKIETHNHDNINKRMKKIGKNKNLFLIIEWQLISVEDVNVEENISWFGSHHREFHQSMLRLGRSDEEQDILIVSPQNTYYCIRKNDEFTVEKTYYTQNWLRLTSSVAGQIDIMCLLVQCTEKSTASFLRYLCQECMTGAWTCCDIAQTQPEGQPTASKAL